MQCNRERALLIRVGAALAAAVLLSGCGGTADLGAAAEAPQERLADAPLLLDLPAPSELIGQTAAPRRGSYVETGLIRHGKDFVPGGQRRKGIREGLADQGVIVCDDQFDRHSAFLLRAGKQVPASSAKHNKH